MPSVVVGLVIVLQVFTAFSPIFAQEPASIRQLIADRDYPEAEERARQLLQKLEAEPGPESIAIARALDLLGEALYRGEKQAEAKPVIQRAISIKEEILGNSHQEVALSLKHLGNLTSDGDVALAGFGCPHAGRGPAAANDRRNRSGTGSGPSDLVSGDPQW